MQPSCVVGCLRWSKLALGLH